VRLRVRVCIVRAKQERHVRRVHVRVRVWRDRDATPTRLGKVYAWIMTKDVP